MRRWWLAAARCPGRYRGPTLDDSGLIQTLLTAKASPKARDKKGRTARDLAGEGSGVAALLEVPKRSRKR